MVGFFALFAVEILADALATGGWSPLSLLKSRWTTPIAIAFVILGDFRYFLLVERFARAPSPADRTPPSAWAAAAGLSLVVPALSAAAGRVLPAGDSRWTFLTYEAMFLVLALALRFAVLPRRLAPAGAPVRRWLLALTTFEVVQYALWALADVVILSSGADAGFALRIVPNAMYYAAFLPFVAWTAPAEVDP
jgi:hypothetical protein